MTAFVPPLVQRPAAIPDDEKIVWTAPAGGGILIRATDWFSFPVGVAVTGIAVFEEVQAVHGDAVMHFAQGGTAPMILGWAAVAAFGLWLMTGRYIWDAYVRSQTRYFVTDRAAYVVTYGIAPRAARLCGAALADVRIERNEDGSGTIRFGRTQLPFSERRQSDVWKGRGPAAPPPENAFVEIGDFEVAYAAVLAAQKYHD
jgi:hypothetical protein